MTHFICGIKLRNTISTGYRYTLLGCLLAALVSLPSSAAETDATTMTLASSVQLALSKNPELQVYRFRELGIQGLTKTANLSPAIRSRARRPKTSAVPRISMVPTVRNLLWRCPLLLSLGINGTPGWLPSTHNARLFDGERQARCPGSDGRGDPSLCRCGGEPGPS